MERNDYKILLAEELAEANNKDAMLAVFNYFINHDDKALLVDNIERVMRYLSALAESGNSYAMRHLGNLYNDGRGVEQDHKKAIEWFEKSAAAGDTYAMCSLGYISYYGRGAELDYAKAYGYISRAAFLENVNAMYKLGDMYYYGKHVKEDKNAAFFWYDQADVCTSHSYERASVDFRLGKCYLYGHGVEQNIPKAIDCLACAEESLMEQIEDGDPYGVAEHILPQVKKERDKVRSIVKITICEDEQEDCL